MRHAVIIMAHGCWNMLYNIVCHFSRECDVFIHIDARSDVSDDVLLRISSLPQVKGLYRKYKIHWGGFSILRCEMFLLREAINKSDAGYFHLISGQDYPVRPLSRFLEFFNECGGFDYMQYAHLPHPRWEGNTFVRFQYFYPYDWLKDGKRSRPFVRRFVSFQRKHLFKRRIPDSFDHLYGSSQWFSICRDSVASLLDYTRKSPFLYWRMWMTFAPEESYIATVLVNLKGRNRVASTNKRFIRWQYENGNRPANLGPEHFRMLLEKEYFFARKMSGPKSMDLIKLIQRYLICEEENFSISESCGWVYDGYLRYSYDDAFMRAVVQFCRMNSIDSLLDMGCGCGMYVSKWRDNGISASGYDANPYVTELSSRLLPLGDEPCGEADLIDELHVDDGFDFVVCKDVLQYIPACYRKKAISNLSFLTGRYLLIYSTISSDTECPGIVDSDDFVQSMASDGLYLSSSSTAWFQSVLNVNIAECKIFVFCKNNY